MAVREIGLPSTQDLPEQTRRLLADLQESEQRYRDLIGLSPDAICVHADWKIVFANPAMLRLFQAREPEHLLGREVLALIAPASRETVRRRIAQLYEEGRSVPLVEVEHQRFDGTPFSAEVTAAPLLYAGRPAAQAVVRDITDRKRAEEALRRSESRFRSLVALSADWYWEQDDQFRFTFFSEAPAGSTLVGARQIGKKRWELDLEGVTEEQWAQHRAALERHEPFRDFEYRRRLPDGALVWRSVSGEPVLDAEGRFTGYQGVGRDVTQRKRMEEHLRSGEEKLRLILDALPAAIAYADRKQVFRFANRGYEQLLEMRPEDVVGRTVRAALGDTVYATLEPNIRRVLAGEPVGFERVHRRRDGSARDFRLQYVPERDATGRVSGFFCLMTDVTEIRSAQRALVESEQRFRLFMDNSPAKAWIKDSGLRYVYGNAPHQAAHGKPAHEVSGRSDFELWPETVAQQFRASDEAALKAGAPIETVERVPRADGGETVQLTIKFPLRDATGGRGVAGMAIDITARERLQQAMRENEVSMNLAMEAAQLASWSWEADTNEITLSRGIYQILGLAPEPPLRRHEQWRGLIHPDDRDDLYDALRRSLKSGVLHHEYRVIRPDGEPRWLLSRGRSEFGPDGRTARMVGIFMDITERKQSQLLQQRYADLVRQLFGRLVQVQEDERHRVAGDLHDLIGQKLTALGINLDIVRQGMPQVGAVTLAPRLHQISTLLEETIGAIREVMSDLRPQVLDEHGLSAALFQYASAFEARTGLRVQVNGAAKRLPLPHDVAIALFRIAQEALTNAAKHSGASRVVIRVTKSRERVELRVEDDGRGGLDRRRAPRSAGAGNSGWGLPMMRERAEAVGGRLSIEHADPGTRILVEVPLGHAD